MDIKDPPVSPRQIVAQQLDEPNSNSGGVCDLDRVQECTLEHDREPFRITPLVRHGLKDLSTYSLLTSSREPYTF